MPTEWRVAADHRPGMDRGLYIAASGMLAEQIRQDQIANDLANASTPGYKADRTSQHTFNDLLLANSAAGATVGTVQSGALESSGADPARSMVDMIASMRAFEAGQKVIQTIDETLGKAVNQVGNVSG